MKTFQYILIAAILSFSKFTLGQSIGKNSNPYFKIVNIDEKGNSLPAEVLFYKKVNHNALHDSLINFDFDNNGIDEKIFYHLGTQSFAEFILLPNNRKDAIALFNETFDIPNEDEGFWFYLADIYNDSTPEILIFSKIGENCNLKIINYSFHKQQYLEHNYALNPIALTKNLLVKNEQKIITPYGSQGLFEEEKLVYEVENNNKNNSENVDLNSFPESVMNAIFQAAKTGMVEFLPQLLPPIDQTTGQRPCDGDCKALCYPGNESMRSELRTNYITLENFQLVLSKAVILKTTILSGNSAEVTFLFGPNLEKNETMNLQKINDKWYLKSF
jgi:hypothetical protein